MTTPSTPTTILIRVIASGAKFIGDDVGGAFITLRDADTHELLAQGTTTGGAGPNGPNGVMCVSHPRSQPMPRAALEGAASYEAKLDLAAPRRVEVRARGPMAARGSAGEVSVTIWVFPGKDVVGSAGVGLLLELPGLIAQITSPATHFVAKEPYNGPIVANVAMMCGCPISVKAADLICPCSAKLQPWLPDDFEVAAYIKPVGSSVVQKVQLVFDPSGVVQAGYFAASVGLAKGTYQITLCAYQKSTGNTGVDTTTVIVKDSTTNS